MNTRKSKSQLEDDARQAAEIASASTFSAHIRVGPHEKYTTRDIETPDEALLEADRLTTQHGQFGRRAMAFAVNRTGGVTMITPELLALSRTLDCAHDWQEAVDQDGQLVEPASDICVSCGEAR